MQVSLENAQDEKRALQLQIVTERTQKEQAIKNVEAIVDKNKLEYNSRLYSVTLDTERWKQTATSTGREVQLLQEQLKSVQVSLRY